MGKKSCLHQIVDIIHLILRLKVCFSLHALFKRPHHFEQFRVGYFLCLFPVSCSTVPVSFIIFLSRRKLYFVTVFKRPLGVTSSAYSSDAPQADHTQDGSPYSQRFIILERYVAVASPSIVGLVAIMTSSVSDSLAISSLLKKFFLVRPHPNMRQ